MSSFQNIGVQPYQPVTNGGGFNYPSGNNGAAGVFSPNRIQNANSNHSHSAGGYNGNNHHRAGARKFAQYTPAGATY